MSFKVPVEHENIRKVIYGDDDRKDVYEVNNSKVLENAKSVCIICDQDSLAETSEGNWFLDTLPYTRAPQGGRLSTQEPFYGQPTGGFCTGFLVQPDVIVTAGHCIDDSTLRSERFVFGFQMKNASDANLNFKADDIYRGVSIIRRELHDDLDFAVVKLDRPVRGRTPLQVREAGKILQDTEIYVVGHPVGLPLKVAGGAKVRNNSGPNIFYTNLDTYGGNSGSPVFNAVTHQVEGILVNGSADYERQGTRWVSAKLPDEQGNEGVTRITTALPPSLTRPVLSDQPSSGTTQFRIFSQARFLDGQSEPEVVTVGSIHHGPIRSGPSDDQIQTLMVAEDFVLLRDGEAYDPAISPDRFMSLDPDNDKQEFRACQMFATVRLAIDVFEKYNDGPVTLRSDTDGVLLIIPNVRNWIPEEGADVQPFNNAVSVSQSENEFLAFGYATKNGRIDYDNPYCMNFDVLAHEMGHTLVHAIMGSPQGLFKRRDFGGFTESMGDVTALICVLHLPKFTRHLLEDNNGNLAYPSHLSETGEISLTESIRHALNKLTLDTVSTEAHDWSEPLTGAIFDCFLILYFFQLEMKGVLSTSKIETAYNNRGQDLDQMKTLFSAEFAAKPDVFVEALVTARDQLGQSIVGMYKYFLPRHSSFNYSNVASQLVERFSQVSGVPASDFNSIFLERKFKVQENPVFLPTFETIKSKSLRVKDVERRFCAINRKK